MTLVVFFFLLIAAAVAVAHWAYARGLREGFRRGHVQGFMKGAVEACRQLETEVHRVVTGESAQPEKRRPN